MNSFNEPRIIFELSWESIFRVILVLLLLVAVWYFRQLILLILVAFVIALLLETPINFFARKLKRRGLGIALTYLLILGGLAGLIYISIPAFLDALETAITRFNVLVDYSSIIQLLEKIDLSKLNNSDLINLFSSFKNPIGQTIINSLNLLSRFSGGAFSLFFVLILALFFNIELKNVESGIRILVPFDYEQYAVYLLKKAKIKIDRWFYSQLLLSLFVGVLLFIGLKILNVHNALFLSLLAAFLDFVPYFGPTAAGFVAAMFAFSQSKGLLLGISVIIVFVLIQFLENIIAPIIRSRSMELSPLTIIIAVVVGGKLAGALGVILALPLTAILLEFIKDLRQGTIQKFKPQKELI